MTSPEKPFEGADFERFSLKMEALDLPQMINSLMAFQHKYVLAANDAERKEMEEEWDNLALAAVELAEAEDDLMRVDNFSRQGSEAHLLVQQRLQKDKAA